MSFSLADSILNFSDPDKESRLKALLPVGPPQRPPTGEAKARPKASGPRKQVKGARGTAKNGAPEAHGAEKKAPPEILRLKALFGEVSSEWPKLVKAVQELREALLEEAGAQDSSSLTRHRGKGIEEPQRDRSDRLDEGGGAPPLSSPGPQRETPPPSSVGSTESSDVHSKLAELLKLLKQSLEAKGSNAASIVEIPKHLTLEIAREVAGRVKESLVSLPRAAPDGGQSSSKGRGVFSPEELGAPKKIPLDDVAAIIDQITGMR